MTADSPSPPSDVLPPDRSTLRRLMLFFGIVYVVEGLGQTGGLITAAGLLPQGIPRLDADSGHGFSDAFQSALGDQAALWRRIGFHPAVRLSPKELPRHR